jgi:hypothetical protein
VPVHHEPPPLREVVAVTESLKEVEGDEEVGGPGRDERAELPVDPDMTLHRPPALRHAMGLGAPDAPVLDDAGLADDV